MNRESTMAAPPQYPGAHDRYARAVGDHEQLEQALGELVDRVAEWPMVQTVSMAMGGGRRAPQIRDQRRRICELYGSRTA
jgi:hypothetical protein